MYSFMQAVCTYPMDPAHMHGDTYSSEFSSKHIRHSLGRSILVTDGSRSCPSRDVLLASSSPLLSIFLQVIRLLLRSDVIAKPGAELSEYDQC
jgi:hypothetical protein